MGEDYSKYLQGRTQGNIRAYASDLRCFQRFLEATGAPAVVELENGSFQLTRDITPEDVKRWLGELADAKQAPATIIHKLVAVGAICNRLGRPNPTHDAEVGDLLEGIKRALGMRQRKMKALTPELLARMINALPTAYPQGYGAVRAWAVLMVGFAGGFRRSELVAVRVEHLKFRRDGVVEVLVPRSKTDQFGVGMTKILAPNTVPALCPVTALRQWLTASHISEGFVFRSFTNSRCVILGERSMGMAEVGGIVRRTLIAAGVTNPKDYFSHSLRAGFVTEADNRGIPLSEIARQTGHKDMRTLMDYIRHDDPAKGNAGAKLWGKKEG